MSPFGKIILSLLGLKLWGVDGFLWGFFFGHIIIDKSIINQYVGKKLAQLDSNIRILLPFKHYKLYDKLTSFFDSRPYKAVKHGLDIFFDRNLAMIFLSLIGFSTQSKILFFSGIIIGYFVDQFNLERGLRNRGFVRFWRKISPIKLALTSKEARQVAFIQSMAALSAKLCIIDGRISESEINTFKKLFSISDDQNTYIANIFFEAQKSKEGYERHAFQIRALSKGDIYLKEIIIENLFKIAVADKASSEDKLFALRDISDIIELPVGNFEVIGKSFRKPSNNNIKGSYAILGISDSSSDVEVKAKWKELLTRYHPDRIQSEGGNPEEVQACSIKVAEINNAYQNIIKSRQIQ